MPTGAAAHAAQAEQVNSLFWKLVASGILQVQAVAATATAGVGGTADDARAGSDAGGATEETSTRGEEASAEDDDDDIPDLSGFAIEDLKRRHGGAVRRLYSGVQCHSCSLRFTGRQASAYADHLDWHYRVNRDSKDPGSEVTHRRWYRSCTEWIETPPGVAHDGGAEKRLPERPQEEAPSLWTRGGGTRGGATRGGATRGGATRGGGKAEEFPSVPAGTASVQELCEMCGEQLEAYWDEDEEEWRLKNATREDGRWSRDLSPTPATSAQENYVARDPVARDPVARDPVARGFCAECRGLHRAQAAAPSSPPPWPRTAVRRLHDLEIRPGHRITVRVSVDNRRLFVGGLPKDKTRAQVMAAMSGVTEGVVDVKYALLSLRQKPRPRLRARRIREPSRAVLARKKLLQIPFQLWGRTVKLDWAIPEVDTAAGGRPAVAAVATERTMRRWAVAVPECTGADKLLLRSFGVGWATFQLHAHVEPGEPLGLLYKVFIPGMMREGGGFFPAGPELQRGGSARSCERAPPTKSSAMRTPPRVGGPAPVATSPPPAAPVQNLSAYP
ncbi:uncharacterized protein LOC133362722 [Lethenteron reissneri]|uniref:uncharacterized protein LOC133362722 n=1 Tax=Lethenteron reissneri TaxID=7753 RepID=UPI002AB644FB|nr:uncharacterized protein LOC133362722 [Lethenteron reissneri]